MTVKYQYARRDEVIEWTKGREDWQAVWEPVRDLLRFHRGEQYTIRERGSGSDGEGPRQTLPELKERLPQLLDKAKVDDIFIVRALVDSYELLFRRHETSVTKGQMVLDHAWNLVGTPYVFGATDCSWLSMVSYGREGFDMPHNAHQQHQMAATIEISRKEILPGDLLFHHNDDHVSLYLDNEYGGRVLDTQPSNTAAPWGGMLGTGVRVRPMAEGWYCDWSSVNGICRVVQINGKP